MTQLDSPVLVPSPYLDISFTLNLAIPYLEVDCSLGTLISSLCAGRQWPVRLAVHETRTDSPARAVLL